MNATLTRRDFIKVATAGGTGLVLSFYLPGREAGAADIASFAPNAFLRIDPDGTVTITVHKSEMGQGVLTALPMIVAEELDADWAKVKFVQADAHPTKYGSQGTGGSASVRTSWMNLRTVGATARDMLLTAAAQVWNVNKSTCRTEKSTVVHSSGKKLSYGELASAASKLAVPSDVKLKDPKDFKLLGKRTLRIDTPQKVDGSAKFGLDVRVPGMLFATIARSPVFGGKVKSFDATKAKAVAGVKDVVQVENGVAVVATNTWAAIRGREALSVSWDEGQWKNQSSASIKQLFIETAKSPGTVEDYDGNVESALASAALKLEATYEIPFAAHATMEPMNCTAWVKDGTCEIWAPTQTPQRAHDEAARILGLPLDKVTVHVTLLGGGFGRRLQADYVADAVRVSKAVKAPVQVVWTREDDMRNDFYRPATYNVLVGGLDSNGWPIAWFHRIVGASSRGLVVGGSTPPYAIPNMAVESHIKETGVPIGAWRAVGHSQNAFVVESFIDELAHAAKRDPFEFRRQLLRKSPRMKRVLELAAEKSGWGKPSPNGVGRGIAVVEAFGSYTAQVAEVAVDKNGSLKIRRIVCAVDCGPVVNPDTIEAQIEGAVAYGLSAAVKDEITIDKGGVVQGNFDTYQMPRIDEMPKVEVHIAQSNESIGGIGEPGLPPVAPAVANAIFAATGKRLRRLPIRPEDLKA
ncbi:MAG TPA: xanthine dehydrogenase family protein molybdopterin-binding subunit [Bacteroidota bacterium]|nr:xanthine dehydrogenase family protein molybdopterin-binding subunit [Bacteroidota bacterium]